MKKLKMELEAYFYECIHIMEEGDHLDCFINEDDHLCYQLNSSVSKLSVYDSDTKEVTYF